MRAGRVLQAMVACALLLSACRYRAPETILVGALIPLTGASSSEGEYARNGVGLAVTEINSAGGVNGVPLRVIYEDSKSNVGEGVSAYQKLLASDHVVATLGTLNPVMVEAVSLANRAESVLINCGAQDARIRRDAGSYAFSLVPDAVDEARAMAAAAYDQMHLTTASTMYLENDFGRTATVAFADEFRRRGGHIVHEEMVDKNKDEMAASIARVRAGTPAAMFVTAPSRTVLRALEEASATKLTTHWLTDSSFELDGVGRAAGRAADGVVYTALAPFSSASASAQPFVAAYRTRFGFDPELRAATFYDGVYALKAAIELAGGHAPKDIARGMRLFSREGVTGRQDFKETLSLLRPLERRTMNRGRITVVSPR